VSDFVTPAFYDDFKANGRQYSFLGSVAKPFQMLGGGYMSWRTRYPLNSVWQAFGPDADGDDDGSANGAPSQVSPSGGASDPTATADIAQLTIRRLRDVESAGARTNGTRPSDDFVPRVSRAQVDQARSRPNLASSVPPLPHPAWARYEGSFRRDVTEVIRLLNKTPPPPTLRDLIGLFQEVQKGAPPTRALFKKYNVPATSAALTAFNDPTKLANLPQILRLLRQQDRIGSLLGAGASDPDLGSWYCRLMP
jgi:hypothetical protein